MSEKLLTRNHEKKTEKINNNSKTRMKMNWNSCEINLENKTYGKGTYRLQYNSDHIFSYDSRITVKC